MAVVDQQDVPPEISEGALGAQSPADGFDGCGDRDAGGVGVATNMHFGLGSSWLRALGCLKCINDKYNTEYDWVRVYLLT